MAKVSPSTEFTSTGKKGKCECCVCYKGAKSAVFEYYEKANKELEGKKKQYEKEYKWMTYLDDVRSSLTTYGDIVSDIFATRALVKAGHIWWTYLQITFVATPIIIASCGLAYRVWHKDKCLAVFTLIFSPIFIIFLDIIRPMVTILKPWLRNILPEFFVFLDEFGTVRDRSTAIFESIPQLILLIYMYVYCTSPNNQNCGLELDDSVTLFFSIGFSLLNIGTGLYDGYSEAKTLNKSFCSHFCDIVKFGAVIPHEALHGDIIKEYTLDKKLSKSRLQELSTLLEQNESLTKLVIRDWPDMEDNDFRIIVEGLQGGKMPLRVLKLININMGGIAGEERHISHLKDLFKSHTELTKLDMSNNNIHAENLHYLVEDISLLGNLHELILKENYQLCRIKNEEENGDTDEEDNDDTNEEETDQEDSSLPHFQNFLDVLSKFGKLKIVNFCSCELSWEAILAIVNYLKSSHSISSLDLSGDNCFKPDDEDESESFRLFANNLAQFKSLKHLNISGIFSTILENAICETFVVALCNVFTQINIQLLDFSGNRPTLKAISTLASALNDDNISLKKISLFNSRIPDEGLKMLDQVTNDNVEILVNTNHQFKYEVV